MITQELLSESFPEVFSDLNQFSGGETIAPIPIYMEWSNGESVQFSDGSDIQWS